MSMVFKTISFIRWIKLLLKNQESCKLNREQTTIYFKLKGGTIQGHLLSAYPFILVLEVAFIKIKKNPNIERLNIYNNHFYILHMLTILSFIYKTKNLQQKS